MATAALRHLLFEITLFAFTMVSASGSKSTFESDSNNYPISNVLGLISEYFYYSFKARRRGICFDGN